MKNQSVVSKNMSTKLLLVLSVVFMAAVPSTDAATEKVTVPRKTTENSTVVVVATETTTTSANVVGGGTDNEARKNYVSLSSECLKNGSFILTLQTSEPFLGWIYTRDHQVRRHCCFSTAVLCFYIPVRDNKNGQWNSLVDFTIS